MSEKATSYSIEAVKLICGLEAFSPTAYRDKGGVWTIGYGTAIDTAAEQYLLTQTIDKEKALQLFYDDMGWVNREIRRLVSVPLNQNQFDALSALVYNIGGTQFRRSRVLKAINQSQPKEIINKLWLEWVHVKRNVVKGLVNRRNAEINHYWS